MTTSDSKKSFVESIQQGLRSSLGSEIAVDYENALKLVSEVVFTRSSGFVLEFIQNAEDAGLGLEYPGTFEVALNRQRIRIVHNARLFSEQDVRAICGIQSSKRPEKGTLGYLGIGFKSVFKVTTCPQIYSNGFQFKFDRGHWARDSALWRVLPIWVENPPELIDGERTTFVIPFRDASSHSALRQELQNLETELYLFLRWLKRIRVHDEVDDQTWVLENLGETDGVTLLKRNGVLHRFRFFRKTVRVPEYVQQDELTQDYRANVIEREIAVAFALDEFGNLAPRLAGAMYGGVYSFLPLGEASSGAKFPIQADFLVQPGRDAINCEAKWNHWLVEEIAALCKEAILHFRTHGTWKYQFLPVFAAELTPSEAHKLLFGPKLLKPLKEFLETEPTIPTSSGQWATPNQLVRVTESPNALQQLLNLGVLQEAEIATAFGESPGLQVVHPSVKDGGLGGINIAKGDRWNLLRNAELLRGKAGAEDAPAWFRWLYLWLNGYPSYSEYSYRRTTHRQVRGYHECPIVLTADKQLLQGGRVYLLDLPASDQTILDLASQVARSKPLLHPDILSGTSSEAEQAALRGFLTGLTGVQILDAVRVCQEALLPKVTVNSSKPTPEELLKWTKACKRILEQNVPEGTELWVLTKEGEVRPASECLLGIEFSPEQDWETNAHYVPGTHFVSAAYLESAGQEVLAKWRTFFRKCGVKIAPVNGVEEFAMRFAEEKLRATYAKVSRVDKLNVGYDLSAEGGRNGESIEVEVKGKTTEDNVELTGNETTAADKYQDSFYLCVVGAIPHHPVMYMVQNPARSGKKDKLTVPPTIWRAFKWEARGNNPSYASLKIGVRSRPEKTVVAYCDESSHNAHKFFILGGVFFAPQPRADVDGVVRSIEEHLQAIKDAHNLRTVKWGKVPVKQGKLFDGYKAYLQDFLEAKPAVFKCLVIDTGKYPLNNRKLWEGDSLVGYLKFYCVFLSDGLMQRYPGYFFDIRIDQFEFRPDCDCEVLERTVERRYVKKNKPDPCFQYCSVQALDHRRHNLLQLADLLVGAVAFVWNGGMARSSARAKARQELVRMIEKTRQVDLSLGTSWGKQDFNIWVFDRVEHRSATGTT